MKPARLMLVALAGILAGGAILAQPLPDPKVLMTHTGDELKKHKTYQMEIERSSSVNGTSQPSTITSVFGMAPDRMRMESDDNTVVADGQYTWVYTAATGQYMRSAAVASFVQALAGPKMQDYFGKLKSAFAYKTVRDEKLNIDGQVLDCWVVAMTADTVPTPAIGTVSISASDFTTYQWIEKDTGLIRQTTTTGKMHWINGSSQSVEIREVHRALKFDEPLPDSLFQFRPPAGAKEIPNLLNEPNLAGKAAPAFEVKSLDGKIYRLSELKSKVILLYFWASWCRPCRREASFVSSLYRDLKDKSFVVISVDVGEDRQAAEEAVKAAGVSFPVALTSGTDIAFDYHATNYPTYFAIGRDGVVAGEQVGALGEQRLRDLVAKAYGSELPANSLETPAERTRRANAEISDLMMQRDDLARRHIDLVPVETRLVKAWENVAGPEAVVVANNLYHLSRSLEQAGRLAEAEQATQRYIAILEKHYGPTAPSVEYARRGLASIEFRLGKNAPPREDANREPAAQPQASSQGPVRGTVTAPRVIAQRNPAYSEKARRMRIQGSIILAVTVNAEGQPENIKLVLPLGEGLDENAIEAVKTWRFEPGTRDGHPVVVPAMLECNFRLP